MPARTGLLRKSDGAVINGVFCREMGVEIGVVETIHEFPGVDDGVRGGGGVFLGVGVMFRRIVTVEIEEGV